MLTRVLWDGRYKGQHGIARYAGEVYPRLKVPTAILEPGRVRPATLLDPAYLTAQLSVRRVDLFVTPGYGAAALSTCRQLLTVHDLIHLRVPAECSGLKVQYYERVVRRAIDRAGFVLTVSQFSRREILEWTGLQAHQVVCVGNGPSHAPRPASQARFLTRRPYVLFVGNSKPHKNFSLLVAALHYLPDDLECVVVGLSEAAVASVSRQHNIPRTRFRVLQGVSEPALVDLYAGAQCLAMPSIYEGFGLPALEAMTQSTATAYCCEAVGEVVAHTGSRCDDSCDPSSFAAAMLKAIASTRSDSGGLAARAADFSWEAVADEVDRVIREVVLSA